MKPQLLSVFLAVAFYLPSAASQTDTLPLPDLGKYQKISLPEMPSKTFSGSFRAVDIKPFYPNALRPPYNPDVSQMKKHFSQDLYQLRIQKRNNEWRNLFAGLLTSFVPQR